MELTEKPEKFAALKELNESLGISLRFLHVVRNPYDVISTWVLRLFNLRRKASDGLPKVRSNPCCNPCCKGSVLRYLRILSLAVIRNLKV